MFGTEDRHTPMTQLSGICVWDHRSKEETDLLLDKNVMQSEVM